MSCWLVLKDVPRWVDMQNDLKRPLPTKKFIGDVERQDEKQHAPLNNNN